MNFRTLLFEIRCLQNFADIYTDKPVNRQTDRHFLKMVKSCSGRLKPCKSSKTGCQKFPRIQYFLLMYAEKVKSINQSKFEN